MGNLYMQIHSHSPKIIVLHYLSYVKFILRHSLSYDKLHHKNRRPERKIGAAVLSCKVSCILRRPAAAGAVANGS